MASLGLLLEQADTADVRGMTERTLVDFVVLRSTFFALTAYIFAAANIHNSALALDLTWACSAAEGVVVGVDNALEQGRRLWVLGIRHCPRFFR